ncbi:MAG TPA: TIGR03435 family protein [Candidatus Solibacter sp.]|nr:TIGR03435 family protein [Candidatus Solibacter sp.]
MRVFVLLAATTLAAQQLTFEVATVKLSTPADRSIGMLVYPGGRMTITNYTLRMLVHDAYLVQDFLIEGGPRWANEERYSITATPPPGSKSSKVNPPNAKLPPVEEERQMLQALLAERFELVVHEEMKEAPVLALTAVSKTPKLSPPKDANAFPVVVFGYTDPPERQNFLRGENATMDMFAKRIADMTKRPVVNQTGIPGAFDFMIKYVQDISDTTTGPGLTTAVQDLGLKLVNARAPVRHIVIDKAERPSAN